MKKIFFITAVLGSLTFASNERTIGEKIKESGRDVKASVQKGAHRVEEKVCAEGDVECAAKKVKNKTKEGGTQIKNKAKDAADKID